MGDTTRLDIDGLYAQIERFRQLGVTFSSAAQQMTATAARYFGAWGNDEFGNRFAEGYVKNSEDTLNNVSTFAENIGLTADNVKKAVDYLVQTDQENANNT